jgi:hypothetical protein
MVLYPPAVKMLLPESTTQSRIRPVLIVLHTNASTVTLESMYRYWQGAVTEAHFEIEIGGRLGQYVDTETRADSQSAANSFTQNGQLCGAISFETSDRGSPYELSWTDLGERQALEDALVWCCRTHGIEPVSAYAYPGGGWRGIGYHAQVSSWSSAAHICPGPGKIREVPDLIAAVARRVAQGDNMPLDANDKVYLEGKFNDVVSQVWAKPVSSLVNGAVMATSQMLIYCDLNANQANNNASAAQAAAAAAAEAAADANVALAQILAILTDASSPEIAVIRAAIMGALEDVNGRTHVPSVPGVLEVAPPP